MAKPVVNVKQGSLRGIEVDNVLGGTFLAFKGIPYAAPPTGEYRFQDPRPPVAWSGIRDATKEGPVSAQKYLMFPVRGGDDCLYLNVGTKSLTGSRPVMVWIHGGAFTNGDCSFNVYSPDYLMAGDVVFVSVNYRLGVLGFLNLNHEVVPGNAGLKDQIAALKWVQENISAFGGDPNNVTLFGESAGATCVYHLIMSPLTKGLIHKGILQSGAGFHAWLREKDPMNPVKKLLASFGQNITDPVEIAKFLRKIPVAELVEATAKITNAVDGAFAISVFLPSVDDKSPEPVLPRPILEMSDELPDIPLLIGYNSDEGICITFDFREDYFKKVDKNLALAVPADAGILSPEKLAEMRKFYFGNKTIGTNTVSELVKFFQDGYFAREIHIAIDMLIKKDAPTYLYKFSHTCADSYGKSIMQTTHEGCAHTDELKYLFHASAFGSLLELKTRSVEKRISDYFVRLWTDFARTGNPTPELDDLISVKWEPAFFDERNYLLITSELSTGKDLDGDDLRRLKRFLDNSEESN